MKPAPAPDVPGTTEFERFDNAVRTVFSVSKKDLLEGRGEVEGGSREEEADEEGLGLVSVNRFATLAKVDGEHHEGSPVPLHIYEPVAVQGACGHFDYAIAGNHHRKTAPVLLQDRQGWGLQTVALSTHERSSLKDSNQTRPATFSDEIM